VKEKKDLVAFLKTLTDRRYMGKRKVDAGY
jgi:hypothetical protein